MNVDFLPIEDNTNQSNNSKNINQLPESIEFNKSNFNFREESNTSVNLNQVTNRVNSDNLNLTSNLSREDLRKRRLSFFEKKFMK